MNRNRGRKPHKKKRAHFAPAFHAAGAGRLRRGSVPVVAVVSVLQERLTFAFVFTVACHGPAE